MRDIAAEAGVATGAAYYYFRSKEELVMAFYVRTAEEAREVIPPLVDRARTTSASAFAPSSTRSSKQFEEHRRLMVALRAHRHRSEASALAVRRRDAATCATPASTSSARALDGLETADAEGSRRRSAAAALALSDGHHPLLDVRRVAGQRRTRALLDGTIDLVVRLIQLSSLPMMGRAAQAAAGDPARRRRVSRIAW